MKVKSQITISLAQLLAALVVLPLIFYVFTHNHVYTAALSTMSFIFPDSNTFLPLILAVLFSILLIMILFGSEKVISRTYMFLWILLLPSVLWFSNFDWFKALGLPVDFGMLAANLPFAEVLATSLVLVTTGIFLSLISQIKKTKRELLARGASEVDTGKAMTKQSFFFSTLVLGCIGVVSLIAVASSIAKIAVQTWLTSLPYLYTILGLAGAVALMICVVLYLRSHAQISEKDLIGLNQTGERALVECKYLAESRNCDAIRKSDIWGVKPEECHNKVKHACCYLCNLRKNCGIRCDFLEQQGAKKEAENLRPINVAMSFDARSRNE
jgi:hypothetical protein